MSERRRILVVSHPNVVSHNQLVYHRLVEFGWDIHLVVPNRWRDDYSPDGFVPQPHADLKGTFARVRVARPGAIQRHFYVTQPIRWFQRYQPHVLFLEQEPYSIPTLQWGLTAQRLAVPWGVQGDDNMDRRLPIPARAIRAWAMKRASYIAARSPGAADTMIKWGAQGRVGVVPHTIPEWCTDTRGRTPETSPFTIGFAGRLVAAKGLDDLLTAVRALQFPSRLLIVGNGPLRTAIAHADLGLADLEVRTGVQTHLMQAAYREMDVLVLPSRTTAVWAEQFGKVLCEALLCGVPVIGSSSGSIPWVVETTGGGRLFPEGDCDALAQTITELHDNPIVRSSLARTGLAGVREHFTPRVAAGALDGLLRGAI